MSVGNTSTSNQQPIIHATVGGALQTATHHGVDQSVRVAGERERLGAIAAGIGAGAVLNAAEIALRSNAHTVVLIGQLSASRRVEIEASNAPIHPRVVLQAPLVGFGYAAAMNLRYANAPHSLECLGASYHRQNNWVALTESSINVHVIPMRCAAYNWSWTATGYEKLVSITDVILLLGIGYLKVLKIQPYLTNIRMHFSYCQLTTSDSLVRFWVIWIDKVRAVFPSQSTACGHKDTTDAVAISTRSTRYSCAYFALMWRQTCS